MSSDPLARSDIWTGAPSETEYDAVYAAVTATERGRWFLTEYANRNRHADTELLVAAMERIEAGMTASGEGTANGSSPLDLAAAAERIQDIALGLRERAVDPALCDALDAAAREISQAVAHGTAAAIEDAVSDLIEAAPAAANENANGSGTAAIDDVLGATLFDMEAEASKRFTEAVAALATSLTSLTEQSAPPAEQPEASSGEDLEASAVPQSPPADVVIPPPDYAEVSVPASQELLPPTEPTRRWHIEAPDFVFQRPSRHTDESPGEVNDRPSPHSTATPIPLEPDEDPDDLFEPMPNGGRLSQASAPTSPPVPTAAPPQSGRAAPVLAVAPPVPRDPLADIRGLSEEELIALFG